MFYGAVIVIKVFDGCEISLSVQDEILFALVDVYTLEYGEFWEKS